MSGRMKRALGPLLDKQLLVIAGKGGVGRTTVAAALASYAAETGRKVLLAQTKSKERLSHLFGVPPVGSEIVQVRERLWAVNMTPQAALREYGAMVLHSEFVARQVLENRVSRAFLRAIPGLEDYSMLGKVWYHTTETEGGRPRFDLVILDGPATGHIVSLLRIPDAILEAVPDGPLTKPAAATRDLLRDPTRAAMIIITLAEDLPASEAIELGHQVSNLLEMPLGPLVVNALYPARFREGVSARAVESLEAVIEDDELSPLLAAARTAKRRRALNDHYVEHLRQALPIDQIHLPYLFRTDFGPEGLEEVVKRLAKSIPR
jgi:anion-transporting  ArsA/GET3 family ATPase